MKAQIIRLFDVFFVGPLVFWGGWKVSPSEPVRGGLLMLLGLLTSAYNGSNYVKKARQLGRDTSEFDPWELRRGIEVEMEHTDDPAEAKVIAVDHLLENSRYYSKLTRAGL